MEIVVTGAGLITPLGAGLDEFKGALFRAVPEVRPSAVIEIGEDGPAVFEVQDFNPQTWLGRKGIRVLDRSARLLAVAAQLALISVGREVSGEDQGDPESGLVCGTIFGSVHSIASFDWSGLEDGVKYVNPMSFPNTVINSPAGQAAIRHKLGAVNSTISAGLASGLLALQYASDALRFGRASMLLAGGVEEIAEESYLGFLKNGWLSEGARVKPFSATRDGVVLGEGSALLVLERGDGAAARGAQVLARLAGFGNVHDAHAISAFSPRPDGAARAIEYALRDAGIGPKEIGGIVSGASGSKAGDEMELKALRAVFGSRLSEIPVACPKALGGEALGASSAIGAAVAVCALEAGQLPPTAVVEEVPEDLKLSAEAQPLQGDYLLVTGFSCDGNNAALVIKR
jgi:3-oxoacyl-[acyl-carrier-protein] synthase II